MSEVYPPVLEHPDKNERAAVFHRHSADVVDTASMTTSFVRKASFRPEEEIAVRRDVIEAFRRSCMQDLVHSSDVPETSEQSMIGAILAEEALGNWEQSAQLLTKLKRTKTFTAQDWTIARRIYRALNEAGWVAESLEQEWALKKSQDTLSSMLAGLERALVAWRSGMPAADALKWLDRVESDIEWNAIPEFSLLWLTQLRLDALLESNRCDEALQVLSRVIGHPNLEPSTQRYLICQQAIWLNTFGYRQDATQILIDVARESDLPGDLSETLIGLLSEEGRTGDLFGFLCEIQTKIEFSGSLALTFATLLQTMADNALEARRVLRAISQKTPGDVTLLRTRQHLLQSRHLSGQDDISTELVDVLNMRLEGALSPQERVHVLTELGRCYELEVNFGEAAAEVYREALALNSRHVPALRALGRLYMHSENWQGLADLYEHEINAFHDSDSVWRRHYQVAQIYETRLFDDDKAIAHYRRVLFYKKHYLPAIKALARLLNESERWEQFIEVFGELVQTVPNQRQKLYLLEKIADIAEHQLQDLDHAIIAWQEIHRLEPQSVRAFSALGRLYARTQKWHELIALNLKEIELLHDAEEMASFYLRNAEICEHELFAWDDAERFYQNALSLVPDFLPALEGLGRMYIRNEQWEDVVRMTERELRVITDEIEALRQMDALAELFQSKLSRHGEAIDIYRHILARDSDCLSAFYALQRLYREEKQWDDILELLQMRLHKKLNSAERVALLGEVAFINEWHTEDLPAAFAYYMAALKQEPSNVHWLDGVARTWSRAGQQSGDVADELEDLLMKSMQAMTRDRYFTVIARLRERAEVCPEASRAYRAHGTVNSLENQIVLRLAMARGQERDALAKARTLHPHFALEAAIHAERLDVPETTFKALKASMSKLQAPEKQWLLQEMPVEVSAPFIHDGVSPEQLLSRDMNTILTGGNLHHSALKSEQHFSYSSRLRALEARKDGDFDSFMSWTRQEIAVNDNHELAVRRLLEMADFAKATNSPSISLPALYEEIVHWAFPEMIAPCDKSSDIKPAETADDGDVSVQPTEILDEILVDGDDEYEQQGQDINEQRALDRAFEEFNQCSDGPTLDYLYDALESAGEYQLLFDSLSVHVQRPGLSANRRQYLYRLIADTAHHRLSDFNASIQALHQLWELSQNADNLRELVELCLKDSNLDQAIYYQQRHYEDAMAQQVDTERQIRSGLWLSELLVRHEERLQDGIDCLEHLLDNYDDCDLMFAVRRTLAHAYALAQKPYRAVEMFEAMLDPAVVESQLDDWRKLISVYRHQLDDIHTAYSLQWNIVRHYPTMAGEIEQLLVYATTAKMIGDCARELEQFAHCLGTELKIKILTRVAEAFDEDLRWYEDAARLYQQLIDISEDDNDAIRYFLRRQAYCLAQITGREEQALKAFQYLGQSNPYESDTYLGLSLLFERTQCHDRLRVTRQVLRALGFDVELVDGRMKTKPSREISEQIIAQYMLPDALKSGVFTVLDSVVPFAEKAWGSALPQRKALDGERPKQGYFEEVCDALDMAMSAFGVKRYKAQIGDSGPMAPQIIAESTPMVWLNRALMEGMGEAGIRFVAGYCAALSWSGMPALMILDGRQVWHLIEGIWLRQSGAGFTERVDVISQQLAEQFASPFHSGARKRVAQSLEPVLERMVDIHCEAWPQAVTDFAYRCGLIFSGDVKEAIHCILRMEGCELALNDPAAQKQIRNSRSIEALLAFALSDDYLESRYALGLAGRPSKLNV